MNPAMKINEATFQSRFILLPPDTIDSRRSLTLKRVEAVPEKINVEVVEQGSEPFLSPFPCASRAPSKRGDMRFLLRVRSMRG